VTDRNRLATLERLAGFNEAQAARTLADRMRQLDSEEQRLRQLAAYQEEYRGRDLTAAHVAELATTRRFIERLHAAVRQQAEAVQRAKDQVDQASTHWRATRARQKALGRLREREAERLAEQTDRREQGRLDELATNRAARQESDPPEV
jgi:flagellar protein FliJ